ncbi:hypothetical protein PIROE2DRAFT_15730 [Piromyces sp. E2]|nr:hypothetical protein PIROE2DRAFT_15730 [Piromyces sp. E2]|eukprot:OUM58903.1 hypothetical protein PIROE2DRAFT_15730 [Piromyces sp. E2]
MNIRNSTFSNCIEENGIFKFDDEKSYCGVFNIRNTEFLYNESVKGGVVYVGLTDRSRCKISFYDSTFRNNIAKMYGGVIFSIDDSVKEKVLFDHCEFFNNTSDFGNIAYSLNMNSEPNFIFDDPSTLQELKSMSNSFVTNPTKLVFSTDSHQINEVYSGELINEEIIGKKKIFLVNI